MQKDLNLLSKEIHQNAKDKGFWDKPRNMGELFMLIVSELGEALEAHRKGRFSDWDTVEAFEAEWAVFVTEDPTTTKEEGDEVWQGVFERKIKDTFEDELADVVIRLLDYVGHRGLAVDIEQNSSRDKPHPTMVNVGQFFIETIAYIEGAYKLDYSVHELNCANLTGELKRKLNSALIRIFDLADAMSIDLLRNIEAKMRYNQTRERLHGKSY